MDQDHSASKTPVAWKAALWVAAFAAVGGALVPAVLKSLPAGSIEPSLAALRQPRLLDWLLQLWILCLTWAAVMAYRWEAFHYIKAKLSGEEVALQEGKPGTPQVKFESYCVTKAETLSRETQR